MFDLKTHNHQIAQQMPAYVYRGQPDIAYFPVAPLLGRWGFLEDSPDAHLLPPPDKEGKRLLLYVGDANTACGYAGLHSYRHCEKDGVVKTYDSLSAEELYKLAEDQQPIQDYVREYVTRLYRMKTSDILERLGPDAVIIRDTAQRGNSWAIVGSLTELVPVVHIQQILVPSPSDPKEGVIAFQDTSTGALVRGYEIEKIEPTLAKMEEPKRSVPSRSLIINAL